VQFKILTVICLMAISAAPHLYAQRIYTWTDENGVTHFTDQAPPKNARVEDVIKYKEKTPQEQEAIERQIEKLRQSNERQDKIDAANAREETQENQDYLRQLSNRKWKRKKFRKRIERIKIETEATQAEAEAEVQQAEAAAQKAKDAAAEAGQTP